MAKYGEPYVSVIVESYRPSRTGGLHGPIHIRPVAGQGYPDNMHVQCWKGLSDPNRYPVGTKFKIRAKLSDREGGGDHLYSYHDWKFEVVG